MRTTSLNNPAIRKLLPFLSWLTLVTPTSLRQDLIAGLTGAILVLPQGVAYALIAGLPPEYGIYTAIVTPIVAGLFGSSLHLVSGPTAAISIVVLSVAGGGLEPGSPDFISTVLTLTLMVGVFQLALGLMRFGVLINFISHTVVIGFTAGAAVLIATSQLEHFLGISLKSSDSFILTLNQLIDQLDQVNLYVVAIALSTMISAMLIRQFRPSWPNIMIGITIGSAICWLIDGKQHGVQLIGALTGNLPPFAMPGLSVQALEDLVPAALGVALLGLIEAVSIARAVATRSNQRINGSQEFVGQGLSNIVGSFFSCYAGSGSFTRSGANFDAGAKTPLAGVFSALILILFLLIAPELTAYLPMPAMAGVIMLIAYRLVDKQQIHSIIRSNKHESAILMVTFFSTLFFPLEFAIYAGVLLSLALYLVRTSQPKIIELAPLLRKDKRHLINVARHAHDQCPQLKIVRLDGSLFFGAVDHVQEYIREWTEHHRHILIVGKSINFIDIAGAEMLAREAIRIRQINGGLYLSRLKISVLDMLEKGGYDRVIGAENIFTSSDQAITTIYGYLSRDICANCSVKVFRECKLDPATSEHKTDAASKS
jgi:sulfate permease, SulP family